MWWPLGMLIVYQKLSTYAHKSVAWRLKRYMRLCATIQLSFGNRFRSNWNRKRAANVTWQWENEIESVESARATNWAKTSIKSPSLGHTKYGRVFGLYLSLFSISYPPTSSNLKALIAFNGTPNEQGGGTPAKNLAQALQTRPHKTTVHANYDSTNGGPLKLGHLLI